MARNDDRPDPAEVQEHLSGIDYPAHRDDLVRRAREQDAPRGVVRVLQRLPDQEYGSPVDVSEAIGEIE